MPSCWSEQIFFWLVTNSFNKLNASLPQDEKLKKISYYLFYFLFTNK